jgi:sulfite oxidase
VKWLVRITPQEIPSKNYFQDHAYRLFPPGASPETVDWNSGLQLSEIGLNCVITSPKNETILRDNSVTVKGFAIGEGGKKIDKVEVSCDGGTTWINAAICEDRKEWSWAFWEATLKLTSGEHQIIARAFDVACNKQPEDIRQVWNFKGYMNNAWHRVKVIVQ